MYIKEQPFNDHTIRSIDCIAMLFWNHSDADIHYLRKSSANIDHVWRAYIDSADHTYKALWKAWIDKFTNESKRIIANYAVMKFSNVEGSVIDEY